MHLGPSTTRSVMALASIVSVLLFILGDSDQGHNVRGHSDQEAEGIMSGYPLTIY